jgi:hypothetical protein
MQTQGLVKDHHRLFILQFKEIDSILDRFNKVGISFIRHFTLKLIDVHLCTDLDCKAF